MGVDQLVLRKDMVTEIGDQWCPNLPRWVEALLGWNVLLSNWCLAHSNSQFIHLFIPSLTHSFLVSHWASASCPCSTRQWVCTFWINKWTLWMFLWCQDMTQPSAQASSSLAGLQCECACQEEGGSAWWTVIFLMVNGYLVTGFLISPSVMGIQKYDTEHPESLWTKDVLSSDC